MARSHGPGQSLKKIATDFGIAESSLRYAMRQADVEDGLKTWHDRAENAELREVRKRIRLLGRRTKFCAGRLHCCRRTCRENVPARPPAGRQGRPGPGVPVAVPGGGRRTKG